MKKWLAIAMSLVMLLSTGAALGGTAVAVNVDTEKPLIFDLKPGPFVSPLMSGGGVNVSASYSDVGSGIDLNSVVMYVDGQVVKAVVSETGAYFATYLNDGLHQAVLFVSDNSGNENDTDWYFFVDSKCPKVSIKSPTFSIFRSVSPTPLIKATLFDNYDVAGFQVMIDARAVSGVSWVQNADGSYTISYQVPPGVLRAGFHSIVIMATDYAGNVGYGITTFRV